MSEAVHSELPARRTQSTKPTNSGTIHEHAVHDPNAPAGETKAERIIRHRSSPKPRPVFFVLQVVDDSGTPVAINKRNVKVLAVERDSDTVLELIDSGNHEHAFYLRSMLAPGR